MDVGLDLCIFDITLFPKSEKRLDLWLICQQVMTRYMGSLLRLLFFGWIENNCAVSSKAFCRYDLNWNHVKNCKDFMFFLSIFL